MFSSLINPNFPRAAVGLRRESVSVVNLGKTGKQFVLRRAATVELGENALQPDFFQPNVQEPTEVLATIREAAQEAGLNQQKKWSVSLPADTARIAVLTLEVQPKSKPELAEVLNWKAERAFSAPANEMRVTFQPLQPDQKGRPRFFAVAVRAEVLAEYEALFAQLNWHTGLVLPRHVSEANWLTLPKNAGSAGDTLLVSSQADGFTAMLLRNSQPNVVRSVACDFAEREDELYRLLLFYRDRAEAENSNQSLQKMLLIGDGFDRAKLDQLAHDTLGYDLRILNPQDIGLNLPNELRFEDIAAPAGLASLAWR